MARNYRRELKSQSNPRSQPTIKCTLLPQEEAMMNIKMGSLGRKMKKQIIKAVHTSDLDGLLRSLEIYDLLVEGKLKCTICGKQLSKDNLICLFPYDQEIGLCCDNVECYEKIQFLNKKENIL